MQVTTIAGADATPKTKVFSAENFSGGMNRSVDPSKVSEGEYVLLKNGRSRYQTIKPVKEPLDYTEDLPEGNLQGIYQAGDYLLVFSSGRAFTKDISNSSSVFSQIANFQMSETAAVIYAELLPALGVVSFQRAEFTVNPLGGDIVRQKLTNSVDGLPRCIICQDGENQPYLIFPGGTARELQKFSDWTTDTSDGQDHREYVPVGKQMMYHADTGILYIVSPDGQEIYRSVSGRPIDFVIAVDEDGNKLVDDNIQIEARRFAIHVDFNPITCIAATNDPNGGFYVSTSNTSYLATPDFDNLMFNEPLTYTITKLFDTGANNQFSYVGDILGDAAFIDNSGVRSFNAVLQTKFAGKNAPFSAKVFRLFEDVDAQVNTCATYFDNYVIFGLNTIYGGVLLMYDTIRQVWSNFDQYATWTTEVPKQFAVTNVNGERSLFCITTANRIYKLFSGTETATCSVYIREWADEVTPETNTPANALIPRAAYVSFIDVEESGTVTASDYADGRQQNTREDSVDGAGSSASQPIVFPFGDDSNQFVANRSFRFLSSKQCANAGLMITFNFMASLTIIRLACDVVRTNVAQEQRSRYFNT